MATKLIKIEVSVRNQNADSSNTVHSVELGTYPSLRYHDAADPQASEMPENSGDTAMAALFTHIASNYNTMIRPVRRVNSTVIDRLSLKPYKLLDVVKFFNI